MHSFEVHSNESACRKNGCLGLEQVNSNCRMSMMSVSVGRSTVAVNSSVAFYSVGVRSAGLVADMVVRSCVR